MKDIILWFDYIWMLDIKQNESPWPILHAKVLIKICPSTYFIITNGFQLRHFNNHNEIFHCNTHHIILKSS